MDVTYVRQCSSCLVRKPIESFKPDWGTRRKVCYECIYRADPLRTPGLYTPARGLVLTEQGRQALREMAA